MQLRNNNNKKISAVYGEGGVTECIKSGLRSFVLEISCWMMDAPQLGRPVEVNSDQIKLLIEKNQYHTGDSQHTKNIQINKVIGENGNCVFYFTKKI